jgi:hypothetical protein
MLAAESPFSGICVRNSHNHVPVWGHESAGKLKVRGYFPNASGADLTFASLQAAIPRSERQIQSSTGINIC